MQGHSHLHHQLKKPQKRQQKLIPRLRCQIQDKCSKLIHINNQCKPYLIFSCLLRQNYIILDFRSFINKSSFVSLFQLSSCLCSVDDRGTRISYNPTTNNGTNRPSSTLDGTQWLYSICTIRTNASNCGCGCPSNVTDLGRGAVPCPPSTRTTNAFGSTIWNGRWSIRSHFNGPIICTSFHHFWSNHS